MFRVKTIDMRAHRKLRQKPCAHTKQKHKHMARKTKSPAMCKTGHEQAANEKTQWQTQAAYHTEQDITWMHTADKNTNCVQQHTRTEECVAEWTRDRTLTQQDRTWSASVRTLSRNRNSWHESRDPKTTLQHKTKHADGRAHGSSTLDITHIYILHSHKDRTWRECQGTVTKPMNDTRPKWQNPDSVDDNHDI